MDAQMSFASASGGVSGMTSDPSSISRTSFSIAAGDTKSIVLALQSLQEKIRKLEDDRNFHRMQCEEAHAAHESYKREVEAQLERERAEHRRREEELENLIRQATTERDRLRASVESSQSDLVSFRTQLDSILKEERKASREREDALRSELESYREDIAKERSEHDRLNVALSQLRSEKEVVLATNKRLEGTVADLIEMNNKILTANGVTPTKRGLTGRSSRGTKPTASSSSGGMMRTGSATRNGSATRTRTSSSAAIARPEHHDPNRSTLSNSSRRSCNHNGFSTAAALYDPLSYRAATASSSARAAAVTTPTRRTRSFSQQGRGTSSHNVMNTSNSNTNRTPRTGASPRAALDSVYDALEEEYQLLIARYKAVVRAGAANNNNNEADSTQTEALQDLLALIDQKAEQLRLMRATRAGVGNKETAAHDGVAEEDRVISQVRGLQKATQRGAIVNELRQMFTNVM